MIPDLERLTQIFQTGKVEPSLKERGFHLTGSMLPAFNPENAFAGDVDYFAQYSPELVNDFLDEGWDNIYTSVMSNGNEYTDRNLVCVFRTVYQRVQVDVQIVKNVHLKLQASDWIVEYLSRQGKVMQDINKKSRGELWDLAYIAVTTEGDEIRQENLGIYSPIGDIPQSIVSGFSEEPWESKLVAIKIAGENRAYPNLVHSAFLHSHLALQALFCDCSRLKKNFSGEFGGRHYRIRVAE